jgi:hypothetical protein
MIANSIFCLLFIIVSHGFAESNNQDFTTPGDSWIKTGKLDRAYNQLYVGGFRNGFDIGMATIILDLERAGIIEKDKEIETMIKGRNLGNIDVSQICERIDEIYKDYSNRHIKPPALIFLVCDMINGKKDQAEYEKELQRLRTVSK